MQVRGDAVDPRQSVPQPEEKKPTTYAVYGSYAAEDYLPSQLHRKRVWRSRQVSPAPYSRPAFSFPASFYAICAPLVMVVYISWVVYIANDMAREDKESMKDVIGNLGC